MGGRERVGEGKGEGGGGGVMVGNACVGDSRATSNALHLGHAEDQRRWRRRLRQGDDRHAEPVGCLAEQLVHGVHAVHHGGVGEGGRRGGHFRVVVHGGARRRRHGREEAMALALGATRRCSLVPGMNPRIDQMRTRVEHGRSVWPIARSLVDGQYPTDSVHELLVQLKYYS